MLFSSVKWFWSDMAKQKLIGTVGTRYRGSMRIFSALVGAALLIITLAGIAADAETKGKASVDPTTLPTGAGKARESANLPGIANDPASQKALNTLMFSDDCRERLIAQRTIRMAWLPQPPVPPKVKSPAFNPIDQFIAAKWEKAGLKKEKRSPGRVQRHSVSPARVSRFDWRDPDRCRSEEVSEGYRAGQTRQAGG